MTKHLLRLLDHNPPPHKLQSNTQLRSKHGIIVPSLAVLSLLTICSVARINTQAMLEQSRPHSSYLCIINSYRNNRSLWNRSAVRRRRRPVAGVCFRLAAEISPRWTARRAHSVVRGQPLQRRRVKLVATGMLRPSFRTSNRLTDGCTGRVNATNNDPSVRTSNVCPTHVHHIGSD
nr:hypothetical protein CFP56_07388 [Quercus suber]